MSKDLASLHFVDGFLAFCVTVRAVTVSGASDDYDPLFTVGTTISQTAVNCSSSSVLDL